MEREERSKAAAANTFCYTIMLQNTKYIVL